jgi:succinoglycan biosynthesis protein ExoM
MAIQFSICVCTYRRPGVIDTVRSIFAQQAVALSEMEIIVSDDDPDLSARASIRSIAESAPVALRYVESAAQNISSARNLCLNTAKGDWIAFIDDDQIAEPNWLREMISTAAKFKADAVKCYVRAIYPPDTPSWIRAGDAFTSDYGPTGTTLDLIATCGVLFRRGLPGARELLFDVALGIMGGEDTDFFLRYSALGGKIVSCRNSVANELLPTERVTSIYLKRRCRRHGHVHGRIRFAKKTPFGRSLSIVKSVLAVAVTSPYAAVRIVNKAMGCRMFIKFWYHFGVVEWALARDALHHE